MRQVLMRLFVASLARRRLATALSLLAIALGVALGVAVHVIHSAALDEFGRGMRLLAGEADLQVLGGRDGFDDALFVTVASAPEVADASPILELDVRVSGGMSLRLLGVDAMRVARVQPALSPVPSETEGRRIAAEVLAQDAVFLSPAAQVALGLAPGEVLNVQAGAQFVPLRVAGAVPAAGQGQALGVMDIAAAQVLSGRVGSITRIDVRLADGQELSAGRRVLQGLLVPGVEVLTPPDAQSQVSGLSRAYRTNLAMLAAIALLTGGFLVFSTQLLAVARRRQEFAFLRAIGLDGRMLVRGLLLEGAVVGLAGGVAGVFLGHGMAGAAFALLGADLGAGYFSDVSPSLRVEPLTSLLYIALGGATGVVGAWAPAREAKRMLPARALRAGDESEHFRFRPRPRTVVACFVIAFLSCLVPPYEGVPLAGYAAVGFLLTGAVLALPQVLQLAVQVPVGIGGVPWKLASARLRAAPGQGMVAGAGVVASVALAAAMAIMVASFRDSVDDWLTAVLPADLYLSASPSGSSGFLSGAQVEDIARLPGVAAIHPVRFGTVRLDDAHPPLVLIARPLDGGSRLPVVGRRLSPKELQGQRGAWVSEAAADFFALSVGDAFEIPLAGRRVGFTVAGVWRDYARQQGAVAIELDDYRAITGDRAVNDLGLWIAGDASAVQLGETLQSRFGEALRIATPGEIRSLSLAIFDRTFVVTYLMEAVAVLIGLFGVSSSFAALALARSKEFGMLRHLGLARGDIGHLITIEGALTGACGTAVGLGAGFLVALVLIEVVNRQSFHWSMDLRIPFGGLLVFAIAVIVLAALAARLSGRQAMRHSAVTAVREDW